MNRDQFAGISGPRRRTGLPPPSSSSSSLSSSTMAGHEEPTLSPSIPSTSFGKRQIEHRDLFSAITKSGFGVGFGSDVADVKAQHIEPLLVQLCRGGLWEAVERRCETHPSEAVPVLLSDRFSLGDADADADASLLKRPAPYDYFATGLAGGRGQTHHEDDRRHHTDQLCHQTALGVACASSSSSDFGGPAHARAVAALLRACPEQVRSHQLKAGHTPLRDAVRNVRCTPELARAVLGCKGEGESETGREDVRLRACVATAIHTKDRDGLHPIDHIIWHLQLDADGGSISVLKEFVAASNQIAKSDPVVRHYHVSPLLRMLSLGTSLGIRKATPTWEQPMHDSPWGSQDQTHLVDTRSNDDRLQRVLQGIVCLLEHFPDLIDTVSRTTGCTPLHVALRNYGSSLPIIRELLKRDRGRGEANDSLSDWRHRSVVRRRNHFGDLPIHVACSVGVPIQVLQALIEHTLEASDPTDQGNSNMTVIHACPLLWAANYSGYTPVDLEWQKHVESGKHLLSGKRTFQPIEATNSCKFGHKQDEIYYTLLEEAVEELICPQESKSGSTFSLIGTKVVEAAVAEMHRRHRLKANNSLGSPLMDRISLLIRSAALGDTSTDAHTHLLHAASVLSQLDGPNLPIPLLDLVLYLHPEQVLEKDSNGRLPIHHILSRGPPSSCERRSIDEGDHWKQFITRLLKAAPQSCRVSDAYGRLPLHVLIDAKPKSGKVDCKTSPVGNLFGLLKAPNCSVDVVGTLLQHYPESVDVVDPQSRLYPFLLAATSDQLPLDTVYALLRRSPARADVLPVWVGSTHRNITGI